ncbi:MAG: hypothetical protein R3C17_09420 [Planctomycetaceae bacterium]
MTSKYAGLIVITFLIMYVMDDVAAFVPEPPAGTVSSVPSEYSQGSADTKKRPDLSESELKLTLDFAAEHHPELARLLKHLRQSRPQEFQRAVRELHQQVLLLQRLRERNPVRYAHQLEVWKCDSQIRVLVAKWSRTRDESLELQIRGLLQQRRDAKLAQLQAEHARLTEQLQKIQDQIASHAEASDAAIDREWEQLTKKTNARRKTQQQTTSEPTQSEVSQ